MSSEAKSIYCEGSLLHAVQMSGIYKDSKTFVDMPLKESPDATLKSFDKLVQDSGGHLPTHQLTEFLQQYFLQPGHEFDTFEPPDWTDCPRILSQIADSKMKIWIQELNLLWKNLCRKIKDEVRDSMNKTSLIYVPNHFIIPGDRFREFYYWDTYWVINGLLISDMTETAKGMIENFLHLVDNYGMVPNGGRIYYLTRSQPPLLIPMVDSYYEATKDLKFVEDNLPLLEKEYLFWKNHRSVGVNKDGVCYKLFRYKAESNCPRPEGYKEDMELASGLNADDAKTLYQNIASSCESGWDFSTRWFKDYTHMKSICTQNIIPVDLNSILAWNEKLLEKFYNLTGNSAKASEYRSLNQHRCEAIQNLMWNEELGSWFDLDLVSGGQRREHYFISNFWPLFTESYPLTEKDTIVQKVLKNIQTNGLANFPGGVPTSLTPHTGQQWDFPNSWPPSVHVLIEGLRKTQHKTAAALAKNLSHTWLKSNYVAWKQLKAMLEKYNCEKCGVSGGGGEYDIQKGFGWTNGVVLMLLHQYSDFSITD